MRTKNFFRITLLIAIAAFVLVQCKKDDPKPEPQKKPAELVVTPTNATFSEIEVDKKASKDITIKNSGELVLKVTNITLDGANKSEFDTDGEAKEVQPGKSYTFKVHFKPTTKGDKVATLKIASNGGNATVALKGKAKAAEVQTPKFSIDPTKKDFGNVTKDSSAKQEFTIKNTGKGELTITAIAIEGANKTEFTTEGKATKVAANDEYKFKVTFAPTSVANGKKATLKITDNAGNHTVELTGNGTAVPKPLFSITPTKKEFGNVTKGKTKVQEFTIKNTGDADLKITSIKLDGTNKAEFSTDGKATTVAAGKSYSFKVTFAPTSVANGKKATLKITDNAGSHTVELTGNGKAVPKPLFSITPTKKEFGNVTKGKTKVQEFTIKNTGDADLKITSIKLDGTNKAEFSTDGKATTVAAGKSYSFKVTFAPTSVANGKKATLTIIDNAGNHTVNLTGNGTAEAKPIFGITPNETTIDFGSDLKKGTPVTKTFTIKNTGTATLKVSAIQLNIISGESGEFTTTGVAKDIAANDSYSFTVTLTPKKEEDTAKKATLTITHSLGTHTVTVTGTVPIPAAVVYIPDAKFKAALLDHGVGITGTRISKIDTNNDEEIQVSEAKAYAGKIDVTNKGIKDLTGIKAFVKAKELWCSQNNLQTLDVSGLSELVRVVAYECSNLTNVNITGLENLRILFLRGAKIEALDLSNFKKVGIVVVNKCSELTKLNVKNGNNGMLTTCEALNCPNLTCIEVDDPEKSKTYTHWSKDATSTYTTNCDIPLTPVVNIPDANFKAALLDHGKGITGTDISKIDLNDDGEIQVYEANAYTGNINVSRKNIDNLTGIKSFINVPAINCSELGYRAKPHWTSSNLTSVDVSGMTKLKVIAVSKNPNLKKLNAKYTELKGPNGSGAYGVIATDCPALHCITVSYVKSYMDNWSLDAGTTLCVEK